ncbi:4'-demethylrebeccamycin synthase [Streptomyces sp. YIM 130001]|uniref:glycosyltransferase n=1 Tax=Streptomyces sp. YIM 130001 TaxID=2259644 RepID=UPI000E65D851|nr:glycosyltransferase [Streptomyces sp. YIM 130001]RII14713.1 4'-demethylrebeccamycin synthase [Streptomyces sp. YIM 130001]
MSRFLLVVPPLVGHINPLAGVAAELGRRGHEVAWCGHAERIRSLTDDRAQVHDAPLPEGGDLSRPPGLTGPGAFRFLWEEFFVPLAESMAPHVERAVSEFRPDVVVTDQHAVAGALVPERLGVPYLTSASTSAELVDPLAELPKVAAWLADRLDALRQRIGDPSADHDPRFSPYGILAFTSRELLGDADLPWERVHLVGPVIAERPEDPDFPWDDLDADRDLVFVSLGTANTEAGQRFLGETVEALHHLRDRVQGVFADPGGHLGELPAGMLARPQVPQLDLLSRAKAVISHSGHNTVAESLWHGLPLVLAPIRDDQPIVAAQVVAAGAGVRVRFGRVKAPRIAEALTTVLDDAEGHRTAAAAIGRTLRAGGGQHTAATHLERLAAQPVTAATVRS